VGARFASFDAEHLWEDKKQLAQIKSEEWYEEQALKRHYFYHVQLSGMLFIEDVVPKNITSCLKSAKFLDFFFSRLKPNDTGLHDEYPFVSPCGREMNFIRPADPLGGIVLHSYADGGFTYGATGRQVLDPASFRLSSDGRLYHALTDHPHSARLGSIALVRSQEALYLCEQGHIEFGEEICDSTFNWEGHRYQIKEALPPVV
jgi:hypothetical protein